MKKKKILKGKIKIIGGKYKGKNIFFYKDIELRPTLSRMRETLFNWLNPFIKDSHCLDCFAGSGILGLESLSRYSKKVVIVEKNFFFFKEIIKNIRFFLNEKEQIQIFHCDILKWICHPGEKFNIVFIDPPFYTNIINSIINLLEKNNRLSKKSFIYIESEKEKNILDVPKHWYLYKEKINRNVAYRLYIRNFL